METTNLPNFSICAACGRPNSNGRGHMGLFIHEGKRHLAVPYFVCTKCMPHTSARLSLDKLATVERKLFSELPELLDNELAPPEVN